MAGMEEEPEAPSAALVSARYLQATCFVQQLMLPPPAPEDGG